MSESTHSIYKTEFMQRKLSIDINQHIKDIERFMTYYNHERYPFKLYGLTPFEVLNGEIPLKNKFRSQIKDAQKIRLIENRAFNDCPVICF